jgi:hypothetical protein
MNTYKGIVEMECDAKTCSQVRGNDMEPQCLNCDKTIISIKDLELKTLATLNRKSKIENQKPKKEVTNHGI